MLRQIAFELRWKDCRRVIDCGLDCTVIKMGVGIRLEQIEHRQRIDASKLPLHFRSPVPSCCMLVPYHGECGAFACHPDCVLHYRLPVSMSIRRPLVS